MYSNYETDILTLTQTTKFLRFFDAEIGTDREVNPSGNSDGKFYIFCSEMTPNEIGLVRNFENKINPSPEQIRKNNISLVIAIKKDSLLTWQEWQEFYNAKKDSYVDFIDYVLQITAEEEYCQRHDC